MARTTQEGLGARGIQNPGVEDEFIQKKGSLNDPNELLGNEDDLQRLAGLGDRARNRPNTPIDRYYLDQDIAQGAASRGMQQQGLGQLREAAMGNAPSQAALMANMARGRAAASGVGATGGLAARQAMLRSNAAMQQASMQGAGARADEVGKATGAYMGGTGAMSSGDLAQRKQSAEEAWRTAQTQMVDRRMAAQLGLDYEKLRQQRKQAAVGDLREARDMEDRYIKGVIGRGQERSDAAARGAMSAVTAMAGFASGITMKTDIAPAAGKPKLGAPVTADQIAAAFGPDVAAAVERSRAKYKPQNALAQMPAFSQDSPVAGALARSNDVPVDLAAMQANASVPSDVRAKKDIAPAGSSSGPKLIVGQPVPLPALAPPQEDNWIPIAQTMPRSSLSRIHSDAASKKEIESLRSENQHMAQFIGQHMKMRVDGNNIKNSSPQQAGESSGKESRASSGISASGSEGRGSTFDKPVFPSGTSKDRFVKDPQSPQTQPDMPYANEPTSPIINPMGEPEPPFGYGYRPSRGVPRKTVVSDKNQKSGGPGAHTADAFLDSLSDSASTYRYKDPNLEPSSTGGTGGKYLGIMAQRVEQTPEIGHQLVKDTPQGKVVEGQAMLSALAGGLGRLHQKVKEMEGRKR